MFEVRGAVAEPGPPGGQDFSFVNAFALGWRVYTTRWKLVVLMSLVYLCVAIAYLVLASFVESALVLALGSVGAVVSSVLPYIAMALLFAPLWSGILWVTMRCARGEGAEFADMFRGFSRWGAVAGAQLLILLASGACMIPALIAAYSGSLVGSPEAGLVVLLIGVCISLLAVVVLDVRWSFSGVVILDDADARLGPVGALKRSWRISSPVAGPLFLLFISMALISMASALALGVGLVLFGAPLSYSVLGAAYALATGTARSH